MVSIIARLGGEDRRMEAGSRMKSRNFAIGGRRRISHISLDVGDSRGSHASPPRALDPLMIFRIPGVSRTGRMANFRPPTVIERHTFPAEAFNCPQILGLPVSARALHSPRVASMLDLGRASGRLSRLNRNLSRAERRGHSNELQGVVRRFRNVAPRPCRRSSGGRGGIGGSSRGA
jgi:hypothetical protein